MPRRSRRFFITTLIIGMFAFGAGLLAAPALADDKPAVVVTFSILGDLVKQVAGDKVRFVVLVGPDSDTHTYEPTPGDANAIANAKLIFENGLEFENWLDKLYAASGSKATRVVVTEGVKSHKMSDDVDPSNKDLDKNPDEKAETDPHAWHDVKNVIIMVRHIQEGLTQLDPADADTFKANAVAYTKQLEALDADLVDMVNKLPVARRKLVTTHDALGYFARRYGFVVLGSGLNSISTESADPSAKEMTELINRIRNSGVPTIFLENIQNSKLMEQISTEAHVKISPPLFTDALGKPGTDGDTYLKLMRYNVKTIVEGLK